MLEGDHNVVKILRNEATKILNRSLILQQTFYENHTHKLWIKRNLEGRVKSVSQERYLRSTPPFIWFTSNSIIKACGSVRSTAL